ncbi:hypothetical protein SK3146_03395 [Paenibacillus konkukensis]|uniref:DUF2179 domain-containing protein n=2 Tax=Paenibacillus konkukensis TaxID=2020716 RepID=A0ABY4RP01_9BACL|nr:hypothetical protein SK3146_03395 [Paenibacillus konkukensis]
MLQIRRYLLIAAGTFAVALAFNWFAGPNHIAAGGMSGTALLIGSLLHIEPSVPLWIGSLLILAVSVYFLGLRSLAVSAAGSVLLPLFVYATRHWPPLTDNPLLAAIYGGLMTGAGLGLVFRAHGNTGGFTLIAQLLHRWLGVKHSQAIMAMDSAVVLSAGLLFSPEQALYALIGVFATRKSMDLVLKLQRASKVAYIISSARCEEALSRAVLHDLDRGLTKIAGTGGYTDDLRVILMIVLAASEARRLKLLVQSIDPQAFMIVCDADDVAGEGFPEHPVIRRSRKRRQLTV